MQGAARVIGRFRAHPPRSRSSPALGGTLFTPVAPSQRKRAALCRRCVCRYIRVDTLRSASSWLISWSRSECGDGGKKKNGVLDCLERSGWVVLFGKSWCSNAGTKKETRTQHWTTILVPSEGGGAV